MLAVLLCLPRWRKTTSAARCELPPGPAILLCGMVPGEGLIGALLTASASLERELFSEEAGAQKRKCLFIRTSHFAKLRIHTRASHTTLSASGLPHPSFLPGLCEKAGDSLLKGSSWWAVLLGQTSSSGRGGRAGSHLLFDDVVKMH